MNCKNIDDMLLEGWIETLSARAEDHLKDCARCRILVRELQSPLPQTSLPPSLRRRIEMSISADLLPVRVLAPKPYRVAFLVTIFVAVVVVGVSRIGAVALTLMSVLQAGIVLGGLWISAVLLANLLVNQMVPGSRYRISPQLLTSGIGIALILAVVILFPFRTDPHFWVRGWRCIRAGIPFAAVASVPMWLILRRGATLLPVMTGAAAGLFSGLVGTTVLEVHCPNFDGWHILFSHLGVAAIGAMAGIAWGLAAENRNGHVSNTNRD